MKSRLIIIALLISLSGCQSTATKPKQSELKPSKPKETIIQHTEVESFQIAEKQYQAGQLKKAALGFENVLKLNPSHIEARFRLGNINLHNKKIEHAKLHYETILELNPRHAKSHYNLGIIFLMQAERYFQYFTATTQDNSRPRLLKLLEHINRFYAPPEKTIVQQKSKPQPNKQTNASLKRLTDLLSNDTNQ
ncbi:MAG: hypothetical protein KAH20_17025 [Methylococcales bacterium]|nr:hypothetical protein [Methylococcales bacterium]